MRADVMLCDFAQVHGGKLFISGAAINLLGTPSADPPHPIGAWIAGVITVPWTQTNQKHHLLVTVQDLDGNHVHLVDPPPHLTVPDDERGSHFADFNVGRAPIMQAGEDTLVPFVFPMQAGFPSVGAYVAIVSVDGTELNRFGFRVVAPQPGGGFPM